MSLQLESEIEIVHCEALRTLAIIKNIIRTNVLKNETPKEKLCFINDILIQFEDFQNFLWHGKIIDNELFQLVNHWSKRREYV